MSVDQLLLVTACIGHWMEASGQAETRKDRGPHYN